MPAADRGGVEAAHRHVVERNYGRLGEQDRLRVAEERVAGGLIDGAAGLTTGTTFRTVFGTRFGSKFLN